jgi:hypothetical protein
MFNRGILPTRVDVSMIEIKDIGQRNPAVQVSTIDN